MIIVGKSDGKHTEWSIKEDIADKIPEIQQLVTDYAKKVIRDVNLEGSLIHCDDSDEE